MSLWYNTNLNFEYRKDWERMGYRLVGDILNNEGQLLSLEEMRNRNFKINFLDYFKIKKRINKIHDTMEKQPPIYGPYIPRIIFEMGISERGCGRSYNKLMNYNGNLLKDIKKNGKIS